MSLRESLLSLVHSTSAPAHVPAAFFLHFASHLHEGQAAVDRHIEYFRFTGMDFVKIQYEHRLPPFVIQKPADWAHVPALGKDFFAAPLRVVEGVVLAAKKDALVVTTLYSPFMCAGQLCGEGLRDRHLGEDPEAVARGLDIITASLQSFVRGCIEVGVDGFYASTQGGEAARFGDRSVFADHIKPFDLALWDECLRGTALNILHVCDYCFPYDDLTPFLDYPGDLVSCPLTVAGSPLSPRRAFALFGRPVMGGMDRHGAIAHGTEEEIRSAVTSVMADAPERFVLGADCTLPPDTSWDNIRTAIEVAHRTVPARLPGEVVERS